MRSSKKPKLVYSDSKGRIFDHPYLLAAGESAGRIEPFLPDDLVEVPEGSELFTLPGRLPVGLDPKTGKRVVLHQDPYTGREVTAVSAFLSPAYTRLLNPAYERLENAPNLPLFAYTAVGFNGDGFVAPAVRVDEDPRQDFEHFAGIDFAPLVEKALKELPHNDLVKQLAVCVTEYGCAAAKNYVLHRWECPLPTSPSCNAECMGCVSSQPSGLCPSPQRRLERTPSARDVAEVAVLHISRAKRPVVSFGQGCEGEPLLKWRVLEEAIRLIRKQTSGGTINLNTNASMPDRVAALAEAGLDAMRVSVISLRSDVYRAYHRPRGYDITSVVESIRRAASMGVGVSLNLLTYPGLTDSKEELEALMDLLDKGWVKGIQMRNLNIDPDRVRARLGRFMNSGHRSGIKGLMDKISSTFPGIWLGYYNPYLG